MARPYIRYRIAPAAAARAVAAHTTLAAAGRSLGVPASVLKARGYRKRQRPASIKLCPRAAWAHRCGMTLPEIAAETGLTQRAIALAIRRAAGLPVEGV
ncbi:MAG: hypothetical protein K2X71_10245 [Methylobacterium sp.]|uniref:hypothetical protein n=1 Tax=Methylobacterium sp. TaxID=409 RepID=UPI00258FC726|nr:hypothetical protein [Methylobacterium sp.]MBY0296405.1 hypothetical protein [Methylobacterium sp.]